MEPKDLYFHVKCYLLVLINELNLSMVIFFFYKESHRIKFEYKMCEALYHTHLP